MNLSELYLMNYTKSNFAVSKEAPVNAASKTSGSFTQTLEAAERTVAARENAQATPRESARDRRDSVVSRDKPAASERPSDTGADTKQGTTEDVKSNTKTDTVKKAKSEVKGTKTDGKEEKPSTLEDVEKEMTEEVAAVLGITSEALAQILAQLNISVFDLAQPENVTAVLKSVNNVQSDFDLLNVSNVRQTYAALNEVVDKFAAVVEALPTAVDGDIGAQVVPDIFDGGDEVVLTDTVAEIPVTEVVADEEIKPLVAAPEQVVETDNSTPSGPAAERPETGLANHQVVTVVSDDMLGDSENAPQSNLPQQTAQTTTETNTPAFTANINTNTESVVDLIDQQYVAVNTATGIGNTAAEARIQTASTGSSAPIDMQDIINQIVDQMKVELRSDVTTEIKITLRPEHLGDVTMRIVTQNGIVTAQFMAESQRIKEIIEAGFNQLQQSMQEQGIAVSQLSVSVGQDDPDERSSQYEQNHSGSYTVNGINGVLQESENIEVDGISQTGMVNGVDYRI